MTRITAAEKALGRYRKNWAIRLSTVASLRALSPTIEKTMTRNQKMKRVVISEGLLHRWAFLTTAVSPEESQNLSKLTVLRTRVITSLASQARKTPPAIITTVARRLGMKDTELSQNSLRGWNRSSMNLSINTSLSPAIDKVTFLILEFKAHFLYLLLGAPRSEEHTSELQSRLHLLCR